jgi:hypothetical protein
MCYYLDDAITKLGVSLMEFNEKEISALLDNLYLNEDIELKDIPDLDLYMDQIITLFDDKLNHLKRNNEEKIMTKTMINNYTKAKILLPPIKKKYSKKHIILLALIYNLKQTLSINDIKYLFNDVLDNLDNLKDIELEEIYQAFMNIKKLQADKLYTGLPEYIQIMQDNTENFNYDNLNLSQMIIAVLALVNEANMKRRLAEKIIDNFFNKDSYR